MEEGSYNAISISEDNRESWLRTDIKDIIGYDVRPTDFWLDNGILFLSFHGNLFEDKKHRLWSSNDWGKNWTETNITEQNSYISETGSTEGLDWIISDRKIYHNMSGSFLEAEGELKVKVDLRNINRFASTRDFAYIHTAESQNIITYNRANGAWGEIAFDEVCLKKFFLLSGMLKWVIVGGLLVIIISLYFLRKRIFHSCPR